MRKVIAAVMAYITALNHKLGEEFLKTLDEVAPLGLNLGAATEQLAFEMTGKSRGQLGLGTLLAAFTVVIAAMVVLIVVDQFDSSLDSPSSSALSVAENDILSGFGDMASLIGPLLLIAIGAVIIGVIRRVQG